MEGDADAFWALLVTFLLNAGLALLVGSSASLVWLRHSRSEWSGRLRARSSTCVGVGVAISLLAGVFDLWLRSANAAEVSLHHAWPAVSSMLVASHYGRAWIIGTVALATVAGTCLLRLTRKSQPQSVLLATLILPVAVFVYTRSVVSHASAEGDWSIVVAVDWLHLTLIALWTGMVFVASLVGLGCSLQTVEDKTDLAAWIHALSSTATLALVGILVTGALNTWRGTAGSPSSLLGARYGAVLFIKLFFVSVAIGLGAHNRFRLLPALTAELQTSSPETPSLSIFVKIIRVEAFVLAAALAAAAVLSSTESPALS